MQRLTSEFWVQAYMRRLQLNDISAYLTRRGDATAGAVVVKLATLDGNAIAHHRILDFETGARRWEILAQGPEFEVDESLRRSAARDPDLWLIEIEDRHGRTLLDEEGLAQS